MKRLRVIFLTLLLTACSKANDLAYKNILITNALPSMDCQYVGEIPIDLDKSIIHYFVGSAYLEQAHENQLKERASELGGTLIYTGNAFGYKVADTYKVYKHCSY